jgi:hypothetical protein
VKHRADGQTDVFIMPLLCALCAKTALDIITVPFMSSHTITNERGPYVRWGGAGAEKRTKPVF